MKIPFPTTNTETSRSTVRRWGAALIAMLCSLLLTEAAKAQLLINGSFEEPVIPTNTQDPVPFINDTVPGWTRVGPIDWQRIVNGDGGGFSSILPQEGNQWVYTETNTAGFSQTLSGLSIGETYTLSGWVVEPQRYTAVGFYQITLDGNELIPTTQVTSTTWTQFEVDFVATASTQTLAFLTLGNEVGWDNITVVPEPGSATLLGVGLSVMLIQIRRRRRAENT